LEGWILGAASLADARSERIVIWYGPEVNNSDNLMPSAVINDPILKCFRAALDEIYAGRIERVVLLGSRARGDACKDSDYDAAVFLRDMPDRFAEMNQLADLSTDSR
jgi:hypothetical protein